MFYNFSFFAKPSMDFIQLWHSDKALSKILCSTILNPVHDLKIKITDLEFFLCVPVEEYLFLRLQHIKHALKPGRCFIFTDFVQCSYFELQQGNGVKASVFLVHQTSFILVSSFIAVLMIRPQLACRVFVSYHGHSFWLQIDTNLSIYIYCLNPMKRTVPLW